MSILELWPFGLDNLALLLATFPTEDIFAAIQNACWPEGFHPPKRQLLQGDSAAKGIVKIKNNIKFREVLKKPSFQSVVDLKLYFPGKIIKKSEFELLQMHFHAGKEGSSLKVWNGHWIYVHDACKAYFIFSKRSDGLRRMFSAIVKGQGLRSEPGKVDALYKQLDSLPVSECLILSWFGDVVRYRVVSAEVHNYEKFDDVIGQASVHY